MRYQFTPQQKIIAENLASLLIGLIHPSVGILFTLIMMGIHLHRERRRSQ
ncbi:hypothetical protein [Spirulina major]|nr:hypothetical protein [Spirulina major]